MIVHWNGNEWSSVPSGTTEDLEGDRITTDRAADAKPVRVGTDDAVALEAECESKDARIGAGWLCNEPCAGG